MTTDDKAFVTTEDRCSHCGSKLKNAETARLEFQGEAYRLGQELERVKAERDGLRFSLNTCVGAAGIGDADELCGWIDGVKAKITKAEQSVSTSLLAYVIDQLDEGIREGHKWLIAPRDECKTELTRLKTLTKGTK